MEENFLVPKNVKILVVDLHLGYALTMVAERFLGLLDMIQKKNVALRAVL